MERGGMAMWPLLALSILALAVLMDRIVVFAWCFQRFDSLIETLRPSVLRCDWEQADLLCRRRGPLNQLARVYIAHRNDPPDRRADVLKREGSMLMDRLEARLRWLAVIGQLSPMTGLLGTVMGLVSAFQQIERHGGQVQPADLASGIWEALLTTVVGLIIAIPCMAAYHALESRADSIARQMSILVSYIDEWNHTATANIPSGDE